MEDRKNFVNYKLSIFRNALEDVWYCVKKIPTNSEGITNSHEYYRLLSDISRCECYGLIGGMLADLDKLYGDSLRQGKVIVIDYIDAGNILPVEDVHELLTRITKKYDAITSLEIQFKEILDGIN